MDHLQFVVFFINISGQQVFHVCPPTLQTFFEDYEKENSGKSTDVMLKWIDTVPPTLKSKIGVYDGYFIDFNLITPMPKMKNPVQYVIKGILPVSNIFNPFAMAKMLASGSSISIRGMN